MPRWAHNKMPTVTKKRHFELLRQGYKGAAAVVAAADGGFHRRYI